MRITVDSLKAGVHYPLSIGNCNVFLDGVYWGGVTELDTDEGWLKRFAKDNDGELIIDENGDLQEETLYGEIVVMDNLQKEQEMRRCQKP